MKHIRSTGCGFKLAGPHIIEDDAQEWIYGATYSCTGTTELNPAFQYTEIVAGTNSYDNYYNLPQKIKGFIMTLSPIVDMGIAPQEPLVTPELSCVNDFDPLDGGAEDYYQMYGDTPLYVAVNGATSGGTPAMWDTNYTIELEGATEYDVYELNPGALEPMIDTAFPPVGVDNITFPDIQNTGGFILDRLNNSWRSMITDQVNKLYNRSVQPAYFDYSGINGITRLLAEDETESECPNFAIRLASGTPLVEGPITAIWPSYNVDGGIIYVDGDSVSVEGKTGYGGQDFDVYLDICPKGIDGATVTSANLFEVIPKDSWDVTTLTRQEGHVYLYVGCVTKVHVPASSTGKFSPSKEYTLFKITQGDCIIDVSLSGGTGGGSTVTEIYEYDGPFKIVCDERNARVSNSTLSTDGTLIAGLVFECGVSVGTGAVTTIDLGSADSDVYAVVTKGTTTTVVGGSTTTGATWSVDYATAPELGDNIYNVRLGHVTITGGQTITIPTEPNTTTIDLTGHTSGETVTGTIEDGGTADVYISSIVYYAGTVDTAKIPVQVGVMVNGETYSVVPEREYKYAQYHAGDIYIDTDCQEIPEPPKPSDYNGPFMLTAGGMVTCGVCPTEGTGTSAKHVAGYYSINGAGYAPVYDKVIDLTGATTSVFFNVSGGTTGATIETTGCTAPDCYSVWIGDIIGATESVVEGTTTYGNATGVRQYQYGNIHVDGRWS